jgi:hypothetical protein
MHHLVGRYGVNTRRAHRVVGAAGLSVYYTQPEGSIDRTAPTDARTAADPSEVAYIGWRSPVQPVQCGAAIMANMAHAAIESLYVSESKGLPRVRIPPSPPPKILTRTSTATARRRRQGRRSRRGAPLTPPSTVGLIRIDGHRATHRFTPQDLATVVLS